jgi:hypothetical protein
MNERFATAESASLARSLSAAHADWSTRTTVLVGLGAGAGILVGFMSVWLDCVGETTGDFIGGDEDPTCDDKSAMPIVVGAVVGGLAGFVVDQMIGHPHDGDASP